MTLSHSPLKGTVHLKILILSLFTHPSCFKPLFCYQKNIFWIMLVTRQLMDHTDCHSRKKQNTMEVNETEQWGWRVRVYPVEVGFWGFVAHSTTRFLRDVRFSGRQWRTYLKQQRGAATGCGLDSVNCVHAATWFQRILEKLVESVGLFV